MTANEVRLLKHGTTQLEREESLWLLASIEAGQSVMEPEPYHIQALLELIHEQPRRRQ
jgi:hypothetical protein